MALHNLCVQTVLVIQFLTVVAGGQMGLKSKAHSQKAVCSNLTHDKSFSFKSYRGEFHCILKLGLLYTLY